MRRFSRTQEQDPVSDIDLTPMIDMVFILLVFFIVSTSFIREAGVDVERPAADTGQARQARMVIAIDSGNMIWIEGESTDIRRLPERLARIDAGSEEFFVIVAADVNCNAGVLVSVIDICRKAGISNVSVATKPI